MTALVETVTWIKCNLEQFKLSDAAEAEIEAMLEGDIAPARPENIGRAKRIEDGRGRYQEFVKTSFPAGLRLDGLKVVVDCANGAAYRTAPEVLWELGAEVIPVGVAPNGTNINDRCGSTHTETAAEAVVAHGAHVGISLDGDADRLIVVDEKGETVDGDQIMALIGTRLAAQGQLLQLFQCAEEGRGREAGAAGGFLKSENHAHRGHLLKRQAVLGGEPVYDLE